MLFSRQEARPSFYVLLFPMVGNVYFPQKGIFAKELKN